jgi:FKBP-type peptidyl-prolyl cis-trans isomerase
VLRSGSSSTVAGVSAASPDQFAAGPVPDVDHATDLSTAPVIHAGATPEPGGLVGADLVTGTGATATPGATVRIHYVGALYRGAEVFDSSWGRGPATFGLNQVIPGFSQGIVGMRTGGRRVLVIPSALGYGAAGAPPVIPGDATLVFVIDLLETV